MEYRNLLDIIDDIQANEQNLADVKVARESRPWIKGLKELLDDFQGLASRLESELMKHGLGHVAVMNLSQAAIQRVESKDIIDANQAIGLKVWEKERRESQEARRGRQERVCRFGLDEVNADALEDPRNWRP